MALVSADMLFFASVCHKGQMGRNSVQYTKRVDHVALVCADMLFFAIVCDKGRMRCNSVQYTKLGMTI